MIYQVRMETSVVVTLPIEAEDRDVAVEVAMYSPAIPRHIVKVGLCEGLPDGTTVTLDNKGWQVLDEEEE